MNADHEKMKGQRKKLKKKVLKKDEKLVGHAVDAVLGQLEGKSCSESDEGWFCAETFEAPGKLVEERIPLVLQALSREGYLEEKISMGIPHYRLKQ